ncbi:hypothetical protein IVB27_38590 [Bradyrhizobium sp. 197]|uniref:hypothetical protein n=1 Tax=Bradyrhizobium sp. 197 TaxID=2782663 RepID=UPI001FF8C03B|nr:hypothetical protein [Bradyrhizobium sp. 197]MCK1480488.1 hypothetical protein [Bradyrhizobium sp. 197]
MPIPTAIDRSIAEIDDLHNLVLVRLRTWQRAGPNHRDPASIRQALRDYADAVVAVVNNAEMIIP